jgi:hypothetical protein
MAVLVTIRGQLPDDPETIRNLHDEVTAATKEMVLQAGTSPTGCTATPRMTGSSWVSTSGRTPRPCRSSRPTPQIQEFFGQLFEGAPEVTI